MGFADLFNLFSLYNVAEDIFGNFLKFIVPLTILLIAFLIVKWIQMLNRASRTNIIIVRRP